MKQILVWILGLCLIAGLGLQCKPRVIKTEVSPEALRLQQEYLARLEARKDEAAGLSPDDQQKLMEKIKMEVFSPAELDTPSATLKRYQRALSEMTPKLGKMSTRERDEAILKLMKQYLEPEELRSAGPLEQPPVSAEAIEKQKEYLARLGEMADSLKSMPAEMQQSTMEKIKREVWEVPLEAPPESSR